MSSAESEPADSGAPDQTAGHGASEAAGAPAPQSRGSDDGTPASTATEPEPFSTGPVLEWTELDPDFDDLFQLESVGDGRVIARAWADGQGQGLFGQRIAVSANGTDWAEVPLPDGLFPEQVNVASKRWVVTGQFLDSGRPEEAVDRVFFSDDHGSTWTEMVLELPSTSMSPYSFERWRASLVLVSGERMVLALSGSTMIDGQALLADIGRLPAGKRVAFALPTPDGVSFTLIDADAPNPYGSLASTAWALAAVYSRSDDEPLPEPIPEELVLTYDEVDFTEAELFDIFAPGAGPLTRILAGDGTTPEVVAGFEGWVVSGAATEDGFIVTTVDNGGGRVLSSRDGLVWGEAPSLGRRSSGGRIAADGTIWRLTFETAGSFDVQQARLGEMPTTVATFDGLPLPLAVGPAGLVVVTERYSRRSLGMAAAQPEAASSGDPGRPELWLGWSADGNAWGLQSLADAFGIHDAVIWPEFAVGHDFVIARVASFQPPDAGDPTDNGQALPTRWFLARVS